MFASPYFSPGWFAAPYWRTAAPPPVPLESAVDRLVLLHPRGGLWLLPARSARWNLPPRGALWTLPWR